MKGEITNMQRANHAKDAIDRYKWGTYSETACGAIFDEDVTDLLTDLMHLCQRDGIDFERSLEMAGQHFEEESEESKNGSEGMLAKDNTFVRDESTGASYCVMTLARAKEMAKLLNHDPEDEWEYKIVPAEGGKAYIESYDEAGTLVGRL